MEGSDRLTGGAGADTFHFNLIYASDAKNRDLITDFNSAQGDKIDLQDIDANTEVAFDQAFTFIGGGSFSGTGGELRFSNGVLSGDDDGDGVADFFVKLGTSSLQQSDLLL